MARNLVWADLSEEQLALIRNPHPKRGQSPRDLLAKFLGITDPHNSLNAISLDLYVHTLQFGQTLQLADDKLSALLSIMKLVHKKSTEDRMPVDRSFQLLKDTLLQHSVQRPPYSVGLFTLQEYKKTLEWALDTYYRHYKLYQYTFTDRVVMNVAQQHPTDKVQLAPLEMLQPLNDALTAEQHAAVLTDEAKKREAEAAEAEAEAARVAEEERLSHLRAEYEAAIPDEIRARVQEAVERELALLKVSMEEQFQQQTTVLQEKITGLEAKLAGQPA